MTETKIKSITIQVGEIELTLTPDQARELKAELDTLLPANKWHVSDVVYTQNYPVVMVK